MVLMSSAYPPAPSSGNGSSGFVFTAVLAAAYASFVLLSAFAPGLLAQPVARGGIVTWAFAYGFSVMALGVLLTGAYVVHANRNERRATRADLAADAHVAR